MTFWRCIQYIVAGFLICFSLYMSFGIGRIYEQQKQSGQEKTYMKEK